jgi:diguanylate cyclase (GGDEF)-like protein/PAS domain S-box-containing protein
MGKPLKVLFVEDSEVDTELTTAELVRGGFAPEVQQVETEAAMTQALKARQWDLVICDYRMPHFSAQAALETLHASGQDLPFIITSGAVAAEDVVSLLKQGAHDFMDKGALARLVPAIERELREAGMRQQGRNTEARVRVLSQALEQSPVSIIMTSAAGVIEYVNPCFVSTSGYRAEQVLDKPLEVTLHAYKRAEIMAELHRAMAKKAAWSGEVYSIHADGHAYWEDAKFSPVTDNQGALNHYIFIKEDITLKRDYEQQLLRQAHYDELTGLTNRAQLLKQLKHTIDSPQAAESGIVVLSIDLDNFKAVNDNEGHCVGDLLLKEVAARLSLCIGPQDSLARMGGDEFVIVSTHKKLDLDTDNLAQDIIKQFAYPFKIIGQECYITCSIGIARYSSDNCNPHLLLRNANLAMYQCKSQNSSVFAYFTQDISVRLEAQQKLEKQLRHAIKRNELAVCYQPIYSLVNHEIIGLEALVRWDEADGRLRLPSYFLPTADEIGISPEIDRWVMTTALRELAPWLTGTPVPLRLTLNTAPASLNSPGFAAWVKEQLHQHSVSPEQLVLDVSAQTPPAGATHFYDNIQGLSEIGVSFSIDDFGCQNASLGCFQQYPAATVKIDRCFVRNMHESLSDYQLVKSIYLLAKGLDVEVVAKGVETEQHRELLVSMGCQQAQGFLLATPVPAHELSHIMPRL